MQENGKRNIATPVYLPYGYFNGFRFVGGEDDLRIYAQVSFIVDRNIGSDKESKPFVFQTASLPLHGTAREIAEMYKSAEGAENAWCKHNGKNRLIYFTVMGYRVIKKDDPKYPFEIQGRIISFQDANDFL